MKNNCLQIFEYNFPFDTRNTKDRNNIASAEHNFMCIMLRPRLGSPKLFELRPNIFSNTYFSTLRLLTKYGIIRYNFSVYLCTIEYQQYDEDYL